MIGKFRNVNLNKIIQLYNNEKTPLILQYPKYKTISSLISHYRYFAKPSYGPPSQTDTFLYTILKANCNLDSISPCLGELRGQFWGQN